MLTFTQQQRRPPQHTSFDINSSSHAAPARSRVQAKLKVSTPGDEYEQEADRVAARVMRAPEPQVQRACACGGGCSKCQAKHDEGEHQHVMRAHDSAGTTAPPVLDEVLEASGQPMDTATRAFFEPRFGHDFSRVRVHTDAKASLSAQSLGARAYTVGSHIVFGEKFNPHTSAGKSLLAHELVHVVQQGGQESVGAASMWGGAQSFGATLSGPRVQRQVEGQETGAAGGGDATALNANGCYTCDMEGGVGVCCYRDAPFDQECFDMAKSIIDSCQDSTQECARKAQCAQCKCIGAKLGKQYCQCTGIV